MKVNVIEKAKHIIEQRRNFAEHQAYQNKIEAMNDEKFKLLYSNYINLIIEEAKNQSEKSSAAPLKKKLEARLKELKIGSIEPQYFCKKCNDQGIIKNGYCDCLIDEVNQILKEESGFTSLESFDEANFNLFKNKEKMETLYKKMKKWCHSDFEKNIIYLAGPTGVGKTHLLKCMASELINLHKFVLLTTSFAMHQDFIKSFSSRDALLKNELIEKYIDAEVLFIDDLGTELRQPNITVNYLYQVLNERKMKNYPTIITSNLDLADLADYYDERISSRIIDKASSVCVYIDGDDLRLKQ